MCLKRIDVSDLTVETMTAKEIDTLKRLQHSAIVRMSHDFVYTSSEDDTRYRVLVMELLEGGTLRDAVERDWPLRKVVRSLTDVAKALVYLHSQVPLVSHRDLKPENVCVDADGSAVLVDFGAT